MATDDPAQAMILGITIKDAVTAILIPIVAVFTTLMLQQRQQRDDRRLQILRQMLATRHLPGDSGWTAAINLIPVEFNKVKPVTSALSEYLREARFTPPADQLDAQNQQLRKYQTKLITAIMKKLKMEYSEADIQADAYAASGMIARDNLYLDSLAAQRDLARAMGEVARILAVQTQMLAPPAEGAAVQLPAADARLP